MLNDSSVFDSDALKRMLQDRGVNPRARGDLSDLSQLVSLPLDPAVSLGEGNTFGFLLPGTSHGTGVYLKAESRNPTGSIEDRGSAFVMSALRRNGSFVLSAAGGAAFALSIATYAARAGVALELSVPHTTPRAILAECSLLGAQITVAEGGSACDVSVSSHGDGTWVDRLRGTATVVVEILESLAGQNLSAIILPKRVGFGDLFRQAFAELAASGLLESGAPGVVEAGIGEGGVDNAFVSHSDALGERARLARQSGTIVSLSTAACMVVAGRLSPDAPGMVVVIDCESPRFDPPAFSPRLTSSGPVREQSKLGGLILPR